MRKVYCGDCGKLLKSTDYNIYPRRINLNSFFYTDREKITDKNQYLEETNKLYEFCEKCAKKFDTAINKFMEDLENEKEPEKES